MTVMDLMTIISFAITCFMAGYTIGKNNKR